MKNLNLCEILKGHEGEPFYSSICGTIVLLRINSDGGIIFKSLLDQCVPYAFNEDGTFISGAECVIFPSKDQRDWNKWDKENNSKVPKFKIGQLVRSKISGTIYKIIDNSDTDNYRFEGTPCPLSEDELEDTAPKTWSELWNNKKAIGLAAGVGVDVISYGNNESKTLARTPIEKSAAALLKIYQLIDAGYGGNVTKEEWLNDEDVYVIGFDGIEFRVFCNPSMIHTLAFHTQEQTEEFLLHPENIQLLKDYFMI